LPKSLLLPREVCLQLPLCIRERQLHAKLLTVLPPALHVKVREKEEKECGSGKAHV
jgi:hypothetical protein